MVKVNCRRLTKKINLRGKQAETLIEGSLITGTIYNATKTQFIKISILNCSVITAYSFLTTHAITRKY